MSRRRTIARAVVGAGTLVLAVAVGFALVPVDPAACGSLLAPAFPHAVRTCAGAQVTFLPALVACGAAGLALVASGVIALPQRRRSRRTHPSGPGRDVSLPGSSSRFH